MAKFIELGHDLIAKIEFNLIVNSNELNSTIDAFPVDKDGIPVIPDDHITVMNAKIVDITFLQDEYNATALVLNGRQALELSAAIAELLKEEFKTPTHMLTEDY